MEHIAELAVDRAPPWLISAAVHMMLLIVLGLMFFAVPAGRQIMLSSTRDIFAEHLGEQLEFDSPLGMEDVDSLEEPVITPDNMPLVENPFAVPAPTDISLNANLATSDILGPIGLALKGRDEGMKKALLGRYGGTKLTQEAVERGLEWLARQQRKDGSWSLSGPYGGGVPENFDNAEAATAMALLAFQGNGVTHKTPGKFQKNVALGWQWLAKQQDADGNFWHQGPYNHRFYTQGQCTIAACELYAMTKDYAYKEIAEKALKNCLAGQAPEGGWRYTPNTDSDVSVTGWIVMALQSAKMAGLEVPPDVFTRVDRFLDRVALEEGSRYPYQAGGDVKLSMTAEALLCRQWLGWARNDERLVNGTNWIVEPRNLISYGRGRDVYYWYYATQLCHHMEGDWWQKWNDVMRQALPEQQVKTGRETGSWDPDKPTQDQWAPYGGRLYVTCLSIYMLEVYYRHLPLYSNVYSDLFQSGRAPGM